MVKATINGMPVEVPVGTTILDAARKVQISIPTLCKHPDLCATAACGICIVRIAKSAKMLRACCTPLDEGMDIITHDPEIVDVRRTVIELIMSKHPNECLTCGRNQQCELQTLCSDFNINEELFTDITPDLPNDNSTGVLVLDPRKCISCGRCIDVCQNMQNVHALCFENRGIDTKITAAGVNLAESPCVSCGQCSAHCPTGAIVEFDQTEDVWNLIRDPDLHVVVQIAPAVRVAIGEAFGMPVGTNATGKTYAALRRMGFDRVFDTNFGADLTIMEEGTEFIQRLSTGGELPLVTSCCPAWVDFMEKYWQALIPNFSTAKSPHAMVGAMTKTYYAEKNDIDPAKIKVVSVMPCTAKKWEVHRSEDMSASGYQDVDISITTRELSRMIKQAGICFTELPDSEQCDLMLGEYSGAGTIFGATGGVMEAALRTAYEVATGKELPKVEFEATRGLQGIKESTIDVGGTEIRIAVAHGLSNVEAVLTKVLAAKEANEEPPYHFIEVMACPGGCVGGGGQPYGVTDELRLKRAKGLYDEDSSMGLRKSHENQYVKQLYDDFLEKPLSHKAHELLHTHYVPRETYQR